MKSDAYELHNYADSDMELDTDQAEPPSAKDSRKRKAATAAGSRRGEKYSLRQKRQRRLPSELPAPIAAPAPELQPAEAVCSKAKSKNPAKTKAPPLSKYRRKTANARERTRMREINMAFEHLRHCVPQSITGEDAANTNEKLTKITTLRLAMKYIGMLTESLQDPSYESEFLVECLRESASREAHVSVDTEPDLDLDIERQREPTPPAKPKKPVKSSKKTPAKRQCKQSKAAVATATPTMTNAKNVPISSPESCYASSSVGSPAFCAAASSPSSAYASLSSAASSSSSSSSGSVHGSAALDTDSLLGMQALDELNTLLLESDSDSLHCLNSYHPELLVPADAALPSRGDLPISMNLTLEKPDVELSLRLLDQSTDSFDFASDQQPSACISPLAALDGFHPFADLLHGEFSDIFLT
ncbi:hypothetical protein AWZ03_001380 [Drosophila navojoa]|uniref:BHLH domain-containing protein n=1 Tax=Drosophila navojoa TaxID=7232 RepID=A0A484BTH1_DRONA|nr:helix-loop-helix protein delilah [Drosophila navojoa]TDG52099.1 hypothetical protein AWZ03_001380 [Drosophila navojoa]